MSDTETFEIYFDDLSEDAKKRFLSFLRLDSPEDGNYDTFPIATFEIEESVLKENAKETKDKRRKQKQEERKKPEAVNFT
jgi:hypothetical protein